MAVILGSVAFTGFEAPQKIPFGGSQVLVTHRMIGGGRVVDALGHEHADISWDGRFRGPFAILRARQVDQMRIAGREVTLSWDTFLYRVVIERFEASYERSYEIPYTVRVRVVRDMVADAFGSVLSTAEGALREWIGDAFGLAGDDPILSAAVTGLQSAVGAALGDGRFTLQNLGGAALAGLQATAVSAVVSSGGLAEAASGVLDGAVSAVTGGTLGSASSLTTSLSAATGGVVSLGSLATVARGVISGDDPASIASGVLLRTELADTAWRSADTTARLAASRDTLAEAQR